MLGNEKLRRTVLTQYFEANKQAQRREAQGEDLQFDCRQLLYQGPGVSFKNDMETKGS